MLKPVLTFSPLELCDQGEYRLAAELAGLTVGEWPDRGSQGDSAHAERLLLAGIIQSSLSGIQQEGDQAIARRLLSESADLFGADSRSLVARAWLTWAEYREGNSEDSLRHSGDLLEGQLPVETRFSLLLLRTTIYWERVLTSEAWAALNAMLPIYEECSSLSKGKFHGHRGLLLKARGDLDRAILDYTAAIHFFQLSSNVRAHAIALNNLAGALCEAGEFEKAAGYAQQAIASFVALGDKAYELEALDTLEKIKQASKVKPLHESKPPNVIFPTLPTFAPAQPTERVPPMTPLECASLLILDQPDKALILYDLLVQVRSARDDPRHELEIDAVEEMLYGKTADSEKHREDFRRSRLLREVTFDS